MAIYIAFPFVQGPDPHPTYSNRSSYSDSAQLLVRTINVLPCSANVYPIWGYWDCLLPNTAILDPKKQFFGRF